MARALVGITGASGAVYGVRLVQRLLACDVPTEVIVSRAARRVLEIEERLRGEPAALLAVGGIAPRVWEPEDLLAPPASGSTAPDLMLIAPCSMGTAAAILAGTSDNLIERAADVMLKERRPLVIVPRETPLSTLHLRHLAQLSELGVRVVPAMPAFYFRPGSIEDLVEFVVDRAIQAAGLPLPLRHPWEGPPRAEPPR
ncbi:MAG TPA: UbiX family flavin prenyltransferase [Planctomycetota bacterium]|nr:UbiX family flavin prenyltransferase [Planctomycetota bacterium]